MRSLVRSVRFRITAVAAVAVAAVLAVAGIVLLTVQREQLEDNLDASLARRADVLVVPAENGEVPTVLPNAAGDDAVVQFVRLADGAVVAATSNVVDAGPIAAAPDDAADRYSTLDSLPIEDDEYRVLSRRVEVDGGPDLVVHVAQNTDEQRDVIAELRTAILLIAPIAAIVLAAIVWLLVGRTLKPVDDIRREVDAIRPDQLERRVPRPDTGDEIDRLATTMNEMLERIETASRRQQRFVADASHELRNPLTRMRAEIDVDAARAPGSRRVDETYRSLVEEVDSMAGLVDDLLVLARSDAGRAGHRRRPVDLDDLVMEDVARARTTRPSIEIDPSGVSAALVDGDPGELRRVIRNLLDNAVRHADGTVSVWLEEVARAGGDEPDAVLVVEDDGEGIDARHAEEVFERFTRLDDARTRAEGGTGLGLAIARDIVERHGGTLVLDGGTRVGARFIVTLPAGERPGRT